MRTIKHYRDLLVWQKSMDLAEIVFTISEHMPSTQRYILCAQLERSVTSVAANIAEGRARHSAKDFQYHLSVAKGSLAEVETLLMLSYRRKLIGKDVLSKALTLSEEVTKMLHGLKNSLHAKKDELAA